MQRFYVAPAALSTHKRKTSQSLYAAFEGVINCRYLNTMFQDHHSGTQSVREHCCNDGKAAEFVGKNFVVVKTKQAAK